MIRFLISAILFLDFPQFPAFSHLRAEDGLSQNTVFSIAQDANHNMWFATMDAVDRYDGYHFKTYPIEMTETSKKHFFTDPLLFTASDGRLYLKTTDLYSYEDDQDKFILVEERRSKSITDSLAAVKSYCDSLLESRGIKSVGRVNDVAFSEDAVWLATESAGLIGIENSVDGNVVTWSLQTEGRKLCSNQVRTVCYDKQGHVWAGTGNGLSVINVEDYSVVNVRQSKMRPDGLGNNMIKDIFLDDAGGVWIGTFYGGVDYYSTMPLDLTTIDMGLDEEVFGAIEEADDGSIWIGTSRNGLCCLDPKSGNITRLNLYENSPESDDVKAILFNRARTRVYIGTGLVGLTIMDYKSRRVLAHSDDKCPKAVYSILEEDDRFLWLGTLEGLYLYDTYTGASKKVDPVDGLSLFIFSLVRNHQNGQVWIGAQNALVSCYLSVKDGHPKVSGVRCYDDVSLVQDVLCTQDWTWVATRKGLFCLSSTGDISQISGLSSNLVRGLEQDSDGNVWAGTDNGLCMISYPDLRIARFFKSDGLATDSFSLYAHELASDGRMYFGGIGGLMSFLPRISFPDNLSRQPALSSVLIDGVSVDNWRDGITLHAGQKVLDLYFSVPNYSSSRRNVFYYRLRGSTDSWTTAGPSAQVSYSSLKPGKYTFELKSDNAYGIPSDGVYSVSIRVRPPWYLSTVALSFYILNVILLVVVLIVVLTRRVAADKDKEINRLTVRHYSGYRLSAEDEAFLLKVLKIIEDNIGDESFNVERLASDLCMTRGNLHIKMKKITGESAIKLIQKVRFEKARTLLSTTSLPIAEVGFKVGFSSPAYFTSSFKKYTGKLPGDYRE